MRLIPKEHKGKLKKREESLSPSKIEATLPESQSSPMKMTAKEGTLS